MADVPEEEVVPNRNTFATGVKVVAVSGTPVQLGAQVVPDGYGIVMRARKGNTGTIYFGNSQANANKASGVAAELGADDFIVLFLVNTQDIWIDASVNGEGVTWAVEIAS